jgi:hypothetical protein
MKKRLSFLLFAALGLFLWKTGAFGLLPIERTIILQFPGSYSQIRSVDVQIYAGDELLKREQQLFPNGLDQEMSVHFPLSRGTFRAVTSLSINQVSESANISREFSVASDETLVINFR